MITRRELEEAIQAAFIEIDAALNAAVDAQAESWLTASPEELMQKTQRAAARAMRARGLEDDGSVVIELTTAVAAGIGALLLSDPRVEAVRAAAAQ